MATTVPAGQLVLLPEGGEVEIVRQLCGSITVRTELATLGQQDELPGGHCRGPVSYTHLTLPTICSV